MFRMILSTQWKWSRLAVVLGAVAAFALPVLSVGQFGGTGPSRWEVQAMLGSIQAWGVLYPVLAIVLGVSVAALAWTYDHRGRHVYALSLPVPRWHYVLLRFGAGAVLLAGPVIALWAGQARWPRPARPRSRRASTPTPPRWHCASRWPRCWRTVCSLPPPPARCGRHDTSSGPSA